MPDAFKSLAERQIAKAVAEGQLKGLEGEGHPLPDRSGEAHLDIGTQVGHRIMAEAGVLPREIQLKQALDAARAAYDAAATKDERKVAMARIAKAEMAYNIAVEARRKVFGR